MIFVINGRQNHHKGIFVCCWHKCKTIKQHGLGLISFDVFFYLRPVLAFEYCWLLCRCVGQSVCQSLAFLCYNLGSVQAGITKFGTKVQNNLVKGICGAIDLDLQGET